MNGRCSGWSLFVLIACAGACDDKIEEPKLRKVGGAVKDGSADSGPKTHVVPPQDCQAACCPTETTCYPAGDPGPGAECLTQRDNTGQTRWQLRQTMSISTKPVGNAPPSPVAAVLLSRSQLPGFADCNENGPSGFIQLVDLDLTQNIGRVGFAKFVDAAATADMTRQQGLCMVSGIYGSDTDPYRLPPEQMTLYDQYPPGLPPPMPLPWTFGPTKAYRYTEDFDLKTQRQEILARFAPGGDLAMQGYTGIFYLDQENGITHGYSPIAYITVYDTATAYNVIPIREPELKAQLNDPDHPNCAGVYGEYLDPSAGCTGTADNPAWGCANGECPKGQAPNVTHGYFLITEMEQVYNGLLQQTLCIVDQGAQAAADAGYTGASCRESSLWNPANGGIPRGDWCAATNSPATDTCHDAWESISYAAFQGFNIQDGCCGAVDPTPPAGTCPM